LQSLINKASSQLSSGEQASLNTKRTHLKRESQSQFINQVSFSECKNSSIIESLKKIAPENHQIRAYDDSRVIITGACVM